MYVCVVVVLCHETSNVCVWVSRESVSYCSLVSVCICCCSLVCVTKNIYM